RPPSPVREAYSRRYPRDDQFADRTPRGWDREVEVTTPSEEAPRHAGRKSQQDARRVQREVVSDTEYVEPRDEGGSRRRGGSSRFEKPEPEGRPPYKRRATRDDNPPYEPEDRQWTPRDAPMPLPRARSPPTRMEVDPAPPVPPEKQLPGWSNFHRRRERSQERREPYRSRARDSWHPAPNEDQDMEVETIEGGKRQRIEGGTRSTQSFLHHEEDLPRKVPQHSPSQRPKLHSPVNSVVKLPPPAIVPPVDFQAAVTRAKDVASQLTQANPQHRPRPRSRFDQPSDSIMITECEINRGLLAPNGSTGFGTANASEPTVPSEANERSSPEEANDGRQGSEGSHSSHIVSRMDEASLRDNGYSQPCRGMPGGTGIPDQIDEIEIGPKTIGMEAVIMGKGRQEPEDETPGRGAGGMRAWGNPESEPQRDPLPHTSTPSTNRTYRNSGDRPFARPPPIVTALESLPPRPSTPPEFVRGARNRGQTAGLVRSPSGQGGRSLITVADADTADATTDNEIDQPPATGFSFRQASASSPRKYSLLDRMTDPTSGAPLTVPPKDRGNNGNGQQHHRRPRSHRANSRR
ncbi:hypothetical protein FRC11_012178, partial [Ceratobasidium sp. 423]